MERSCESVVGGEGGGIATFEAGKKTATRQSNQRNRLDHGRKEGKWGECESRKERAGSVHT